MDPITLLSGLGLGVATNAVYNVVKTLGARHATQQEAVAEIQNVINLHGVKMTAETVINALAQNGFLSIQQSQLYAKEALAFGSVKGAASVSYNSVLKTDKTAIEAQGAMGMTTKGNAQVRQNPDGSITFHVGEGDSSISIWGPKK